MLWAPLFFLFFALVAPVWGFHRPRLLKGRTPHYRSRCLNCTNGTTAYYPASPFFNERSRSKFATQ